MTNTMGAVVLFDGGNPRTFTAKARTVISGGQIVVTSGAANVVTSGANSYATGDIIVDLLNNSNRANGIALINTGSNEYVTVATRGAYIVRCSDIVSGGNAVYPRSGTFQSVSAIPDNISYSGTNIGRAMTASASGTSSYALVDFRF